MVERKLRGRNHHAAILTIKENLGCVLVKRFFLRLTFLPDIWTDEDDLEKTVSSGHTVSRFEAEDPAAAQQEIK